MSTADKISVIVPCYNQGHFLNESVGSVLAQTYTNWECIIVNDGSTDNTERVALEYSRTDSRIKYLKKENGGLSSARNAGLDVAEGGYIQFLDADDVLESGKFEQQLEILNQTEKLERAVLYTNYSFGKAGNIYENGSKVISVEFNSDNYLPELITRWESDLVIPCHCFLFSSDFFLNDRIRFDETLPNHEDFECWLAIFSKDPRVIFTDKILCRYRLNDASMSTDMRRMGEGFIQALNKHLKIKWYSKRVRLLLNQKRLSVLQAYKRFDLMTLNDKLNSLDILKKYYSQRLKDKIRI